MLIARLLGAAAFCSLAFGASGCAPAWVQQANSIVDTDPRGAYALAADAQEKASGELKFAAALMAGIYADRMDEPQLAREHLAIAVSDVPGNAAWIRAKAWETSAAVEVSEGFGRFSKWIGGLQRAEPSGRSDEMIRQLNQLSAAFGAADADMARAVEIAGKGDDREFARKMQLIRAAYLGAADNVDALLDVCAVCTAAAAHRDDLPDLMGNATVRRLEAVERTLKSLCEACSKRASAGAPAASQPARGSQEAQPAKP